MQCIIPINCCFRKLCHERNQKYDAMKIKSITLILHSLVSHLLSIFIVGFGVCQYRSKIADHRAETMINLVSCCDRGKDSVISHLESHI